MKNIFIISLLILVFIFLNIQKIEQFWSATQYGVSMSKEQLLQSFNINQAHHDNKWIRDPSYPI